MKRPVKTQSANPDTNGRISFRLDEPMSTRFKKVVLASKRTQTSIIEECLEKALPELERQFAKAA